MTERTSGAQSPIRMLQSNTPPIHLARETPPIMPGALVISLDFELLWGLQDILPPDGGNYRESILGAREVIPRMLDVFAEYDVAATWATVGKLFAENREELESLYPPAIPAYEDRRLSTYLYPYGNNEQDDPLHFAASLIERIGTYPKQEIATHTFDHYYCLEPGQTAEDFDMDIEAAVKIASARGVTLRSIVFPRNQHNRDYDATLVAHGITAYRGTRRFWPDRSAEQSRYFHPARRLGRLADTYLPLDRQNSSAWSDVMTHSGLGNVPAHRLLLPRQKWLEPLRLRRVASEIKAAARSGRIYHIWWHPHNFGINQEANLAALRTLFDTFEECRSEYGMQALSMADIVESAHPHATIRPLAPRAETTHASHIGARRASP